MKHVLAPVDTIHDCAVVACSLHSMFPHHVNHFEMAFDEGDMMLEDLGHTQSILQP